MAMLFRQNCLVFTAALLMTIIAGCDSQPHSNSLSARQAPGFELRDPGGNLRSLGQIQEPVVIVHFWASWCPPCLEEIPRWIAAAPLLKDIPVKLVAISVDDSFEKALKVFPASKIGLNMQLLWDPNGELAAKYGTRQFPETYLLNRDRKIVEKWIGSQDWTGSMVRFAIAKALAQASGPQQSSARK